MPKGKCTFSWQTVPLGSPPTYHYCKLDDGHTEQHACKMCSQTI